jgi:hypothetical protein
MSTYLGHGSIFNPRPGARNAGLPESAFWANQVSSEAKAAVPDSPSPSQCAGCDWCLPTARLGESWRPLRYLVISETVIPDSAALHRAVRRRAMQKF